MVRVTPNNRISHDYLNYIISPKGSGVADRFFKTVSEDLVSGMEWLKLTKAPSNGQKIEHTELAKALEGGQLNFTQSEWKKFGVSHLTPNHFVKAGDKYFKPANLGNKLKHTGKKIPSIDIQKIQKLPADELQQWEKVYSDYIDRENLATLQAPEEWVSISEKDAQSGQELEDIGDLYKKKVATGIIRSLVGSLTKNQKGTQKTRLIHLRCSTRFSRIFNRTLLKTYGTLSKRQLKSLEKKWVQTSRSRRLPHCSFSEEHKIPFPHFGVPKGRKRSQPGGKHGNGTCTVIHITSEEWRNLYGDAVLHVDAYQKLGPSDLTAKVAGQRDI